MNSAFINRLVGTTIVVVAAIVFIPNILDGEKIQYKEGFKAIPERPEFKSIDLQAELQEQLDEAPMAPRRVPEEIVPDDATVEAGEESTQEQTTYAEPQVQIKERAPEENLSQMAYVIQLGSFSHRPNVESLVKKLQSKGFKTFTRPVKTPNGELTKVFVGPSLNRAELEKQLPELKELTKLRGKLTEFEIAK